jgi:hypothetical protein
MLITCRGGSQPAGEPAGAAGARLDLTLDPERELAAMRAAGRRRVGAPIDFAGWVSMALLEAEAGCRRSTPALAKLCAPDLWERIEPNLPRAGAVAPTRLLRVIAQEPIPGLANTVSLVRRGARVQPVAMRLDAASGRWVITELAY